MAEFLARRNPDSALRAEGVSLFRMQQETAAHTAIALPFVIFCLAMGAMGHDSPPVQGRDRKAVCYEAMKAQNPKIVNNFLI
jgi:hypothetical protein